MILRDAAVLEKIQSRCDGVGSEVNGGKPSVNRALRGTSAVETATSAATTARAKVFFQLDTRFSKSFRFREKLNAEFFFQAFDLTNRANFGGNFTNNIRSAVFGRPQGFITPSSVVIPQFFSGEAGFTLRF